MLDTHRVYLDDGKAKLSVLYGLAISARLIANSLYLREYQKFRRNQPSENEQEYGIFWVHKVPLVLYSSIV